MKKLGRVLLIVGLSTGMVLCSACGEKKENTNTTAVKQESEQVTTVSVTNNKYTQLTEKTRGFKGGYELNIPNNMVEKSTVSGVNYSKSDLTMLVTAGGYIKDGDFESTTDLNKCMDICKGSISDSLGLSYTTKFTTTTQVLTVTKQENVNVNGIPMLKVYGTDEDSLRGGKYGFIGYFAIVNAKPSSSTTASVEKNEHQIYWFAFYEKDSDKSSAETLVDELAKSVNIPN